MDETVQVVSSLKYQPRQIQAATSHSVIVILFSILKSWRIWTWFHSVLMKFLYWLVAFKYFCLFSYIDLLFMTQPFVGGTSFSLAVCLSFIIVQGRLFDYCGCTFLSNTESESTFLYDAPGFPKEDGFFGGGGYFQAPPICPLVRATSRWRWVWRIGEMTLTGRNLGTQTKTSPSATSSTTNLTWTSLGSNPCLRNENPAYNRLSHVTAV